MPRSPRSAPVGTRVLPPLEPLKVGVAAIYGSLQVVKQIGDNPGNLNLDGVEFTFTYSCTLSTGAPGVTGEVTATPTTPGLVTGIPAGSTCKVWETGTNGGIPSATPTSPVEVVIPPSLDPNTPTVGTVTVTDDFPLGRIVILKAVGGGAQAGFTPGPYTMTVDCRFAGQELAGFPATIQLRPNVPVITQVPIGSVCTVVETDSAGAADVTYNPPAPGGTGAQAVVPPDGLQTVTVTVTNTFEVGSLVIRKEVTGSGVPAFSAGPFVFDVSCDYRGSTGVYTTTVTVPGSTDGSPVESDPITGLPVGAVCTVTETDAAGADTVPAPQTVAIEANDQANVTVVTVTNTFSARTIAVIKNVAGEAASSAYVAGLSYTIEVTCAVMDTGELNTVVDTQVVVAGDGTPVTVTNPDGSPTLVPVGARCWGAEPASQGASVTIDHDSYANGVEVVAGSTTERLQITVTNTFDPAVLVVAKQVVNEPDPNATYTFEIRCVVINADGTTTEVPLLTGSSPRHARGW